MRYEHQHFRESCSSKCLNEDAHTKHKKNQHKKVNLQLGMPQVFKVETIDAVQKYYAAFPPLSKAQQMQFWGAPPAWCRKPAPSLPPPPAPRPAPSRGKTKERRNTYHGQKRSNHSKRRCHSYSRSLDSKENLPEWVTHEATWDMEMHDPVREFIRAIALDEGYGTCDNTVTDEFNGQNFTMSVQKDSTRYNGNVGFGGDWNVREDSGVRIKTPDEEELYAKFEAKFDRSLEALWSREQANTPDDECQDLPIDFQDLLSSPSDRAFGCSSMETWGPIPFTDTVWSCSNPLPKASFSNDVKTIGNNVKEGMDILYSKLEPLQLQDDPADALGQETETDNHLDPFAQQANYEIIPDGQPSSFYEYNDIYDSIPQVTSVMRSLTVLNHDRQCSSFSEVIPKWPTGYIGDKRTHKVPDVVRDYSESKLPYNIDDNKDGEDLLTSMKTHFKPIKIENSMKVNNNVSYLDGTTFPIQSNLDSVEFQRTVSGTMFLESDDEPPRKYMEFRTKEIDYSRLNLTKEQNEASDNRMVQKKGFSLKFCIQQIEKEVQTDVVDSSAITAASEREEACPAKKIMLQDEVNIAPGPAITGATGERDYSPGAGSLDEETIRKSLSNLDNYWNTCNECKADSNWTGDFKWKPQQSEKLLEKIWSTNDKLCQTCTKLSLKVSDEAETTENLKLSKDETSRDWDELLSDISYIHSLYVGGGGEEDYARINLRMAPAQISYSNGNYIQGAMLAMTVNYKGEGGMAGEKQESVMDVWRAERKRRYSAMWGGAGGLTGRLLAPPAAPLLCYTPHRPLTR